MRNAMWTCLILILVFAGVAGCEEASYKTDMKTESAAYDSAGGEGAQVNYAPMSPTADNAASPADSSLPVDLPDAQTQRKIIYNAEVDLVVDDFAGVPDRVAELAKHHGGFVAQSAIHGSAGEPRDGRWTLRIPSAHYDDVMQDAESIGQLRSVESSSREVTAEFVDLQSRLRNKLAEEARLAEHLDQSTGDLKDILEVERELSRVRGDAEVLQGRLNMLTDLTSMSTVVVRVEEIRNYVPESTEEPGFTSRVGRVWHASWSGLVSAARGVALAAVALTPWLIVIVPGVLVLWFVLKRVVRRLFGGPSGKAA